MVGGEGMLRGRWSPPSPRRTVLRPGDSQDQVLAPKELPVTSALVGSVVPGTVASQPLTAREGGQGRASCKHRHQETEEGQPPRTVEVFASVGREKLPTGHSKVDF